MDFDICIDIRVYAQISLSRQPLVRIPIDIVPS